jgi:hypothetical protein
MKAGIEYKNGINGKVKQKQCVPNDMLLIFYRNLSVRMLPCSVVCPYYLVFRISNGVSPPCLWSPISYSNAETYLNLVPHSIIAVDYLMFPKRGTLLSGLITRARTGWRIALLSTRLTELASDAMYTLPFSVYNNRAHN